MEKTEKCHTLHPCFLLRILLLDIFLTANRIMLLTDSWHHWDLLFYIKQLILLKPHSTSAHYGMQSSSLSQYNIKLLLFLSLFISKQTTFEKYFLKITYLMWPIVSAIFSPLWHGEHGRAVSITETKKHRGFLPFALLLCI